MTLDTDTRDALGFGDPWTQLAIRWPLYVVTSTRRDWRKGRRTTTKPVASLLTTNQRREASRLRACGNSQTAIARALGVERGVVRRYLSARRAA